MKTLVILTSILFVACGCAFAESSSEQAIAVAPRVISVPEGAASAITLSATRWPHFYGWDANNQACGVAVDNNFSKKRKAPTGTPQAGYLGWHDDYDPNGEQVYSYTPTESNYTAVQDLNYTLNFENEGLADYKKSAKILITWSVRLEGKQPAAYELMRKHDPWYCPGWVGVSKQDFVKGEAYTRLFVNGAAQGAPAIMTIPSAGKVESSGRYVDPTHTGSITLLPEDFGGEFPDELSLVIRIYNDTCMVIKSPAEMRNLIIQISPTL